MCILRSVVFLPISLFILVKVIGVNGIWISLLVSELLSLIVIRIIANVRKYTRLNVIA